MSNKQKENLKTAIIVVLVMVIVFGASFFASELSGKASTYSETSSSSNETGEDTSYDDIDYDEGASIPESEQKDLTEISVSKFIKLKKASEKSLVIITREGCSWCERYLPIMKNIAYLYKDLTIYNIDLAKLSDDESTDLMTSDDFFTEEDWGTPLTLVVQNNKIVDTINGFTSKDLTIEFLKDQGLIQ